MSQPLHPGHAADAGALAAIGAAAGVTGALDVLHGPVGFAAATSEDTGKWDKALAGLDERLAITAMTFKNQAAAATSSPASTRWPAFGRSTVSAPRTWKPSTSAATAPPRRSATAPPSAPSRRHASPPNTASAALLILGGVRLAAFEPAALADPRIRALMPRITVSLDPELAADYPGRRAAKVTVKLRDGRELFRYQPTRKGDPDAPLSDRSSRRSSRSSRRP